MKQRIVLIAAVVIGIFAAFLTHQYLRAKNREVNETIAKLKGRYKTVEVVVDQSNYSKLKPGLIQMSNYWDNMKGFLLGVYKLSYPEKDWSAELKKVENKLKG